MKTETQLRQLRDELYEKADWCNDRCNELKTGEKTEVLDTWREVNAQLNLLNHIIGGSTLKTLS